ncbi:LysM peptidoglycan-binding domain-containing protein, partial [Macromonas nakdongensis]|uniref:LysM peptidoglycan-binding domain-containing protein n=1 Tax=Macromonas nakdongensis TaxID=1843082 RepID=UPI0012FF148B
MEQKVPRLGRLSALTCVCVAAALLAACAAPSKTSPRAPVVDRSPSGAAAALPGAENAGKPGYYTVRPGDTLMRIGLETGQGWRDLQAWNGLVNPNLIEVGQVLRVVPPVGTPAPAATAGGPATSAVSTSAV